MNRRKAILFLAVVFLVCLIGCGEQEKTEHVVSGSAADPEETMFSQQDSVSGEAVGGREGSISGDEEGSSELSRICCQFVKQIVSGLMSPVIETMTPELAAQTTEEQLKSSWENETQGLTGYQGIETVVETVGNMEQTVTVTVRYANNNGIKVIFTFDSEEFIQQIFFKRVTLPSLQAAGQQKSEDAGQKSDEQLSYDYEEVAFSVGRKPYVLDGVFTAPKTSGKMPVVLLLSGGDSLDMDGTVGQAGNTPMRDIAYGLANKGIASLRYHKRAYQYPSVIPSNAGTYDLFLQDALYAIDQIYNDRRIDRKKIYVLGHDKAADYLPAVLQKKEKRLAGAVMLAGRPVAVTEQYYSQKEKNIRFDAKYLMDKNSTLPLLVLQGRGDFETSMKDYKQWPVVLKGRAHIEYRSFEKLNHYFINSSKKMDSSDYDLEGKVSASVINHIAAWCKKKH